MTFEIFSCNLFKISKFISVPLFLHLIELINFSAYHFIILFILPNDLFTHNRYRELEYRKASLKSVFYDLPKSWMLLYLFLCSYIRTVLCILTRIPFYTIFRQFLPTSLPLQDLPSPWKFQLSEDKLLHSFCIQDMLTDVYLLEEHLYALEL